MLRPRTSELRAAGAAATAAALSASFTAVPYVEFGVAAMPNLAAYGVAVPTMVLITSTLRHRDRIPLAVLALVGIFSVHITGGVVVMLLLGARWLFEELWHPVRGRIADVLTLAGVGVGAGLILLPQFISVTQQEDIIAGHAFPTYLSKKTRPLRRRLSALAPSQRFSGAIRDDRAGRRRRGDSPDQEEYGGRWRCGCC